MKIRPRVLLTAELFQIFAPVKPTGVHERIVSGDPDSIQGAVVEFYIPAELTPNKEKDLPIQNMDFVVTYHGGGKGPISLSELQRDYEIVEDDPPPVPF